ncbi:MAG TPA: serine hydrolase [Gemmatimonadaceae bacterium]|jgi:CubicO group peptidase (beta-lactamase class C family)
MKSLRILAASVLVCSAVAGAQDAADRCIADSGRTLRQRMLPLMDSASIPGIALALIDGGKVVWRGGFGTPNSKSGRVSADRTVFEAASLSKPVIAYAALKLVDAGQLDLDRPLVDYTPYPDFHGHPRGQLVTAKMVLSHTSGLQNERFGNDSLRFAFTPGSRFQYSGEGYVFLGKAIEAITGRPLADEMKALVLEPLGMNRSSFIWESRFEDDAAIGHGRIGEVRKRTRPRVARAPSSLQTTASDYARFLQAIINGTGLQPQTWRSMQTAAVEVAPGVGWGLGWAIEQDSTGRELVHHGDNSDSGFTAFTLLNVERQCGLVYFANSANGLSVVKELAAVIPGSHPGLAMLEYEPYTAPGALARTQIAAKLRAGGIDAAMAEYHRIQEANPEATPEKLLNDLGYSLLSQARYKDAIRAFRENIMAYPTSANVYDSMGDAYLADGHPTAARDAYRRATELDSTNTRARRLADSLNARLRH